MNARQANIAQRYLRRINQKIQLRYIIIGAIALGAAVASFFVYRYITVRNTQRAQGVFSESMEAFTKMSQAASSNRNWKEVAEAFDEAFKRYPRTSFSPAMLAYKATALAFDNQITEAIEVMQSAVNSLKESSPLYYPYRTKLALLKYDSPDKSVQDAGNKELEELAANRQNPVQDWAQYYYGYFAFISGNKAQARTVWNELISQHAKSPWAEEARNQLTLITDAPAVPLAKPEKKITESPTPKADAALQDQQTSIAQSPSTTKSLPVAKTVPTSSALPE